MADEGAMPVQALADLEDEAFVQKLGAIYEKSPWVVRNTTSCHINSSRTPSQSLCFVFVFVFVHS